MVSYPPKRPTFSQIREGLDNSEFFSIMFQNFITLLPKEQLEGCLIITASNLNRKKINGLVHSKFEGIIF